MQSSFVVLLLAAIVAVVVRAAPQLPSPSPSCSVDEHMQMPCICCKKDCWHTIAAAATHELGHMPGEAGEREAMATLKLIRACMMAECAPICASSPF